MERSQLARLLKLKWLKRKLRWLKRKCQTVSKKSPPKTRIARSVGSQDLENAGPEKNRPNRNRLLSQAARAAAAQAAALNPSKSPRANHKSRLTKDADTTVAPNPHRPRTDTRKNSQPVNHQSPTKDADNSLINFNK